MSIEAVGAGIGAGGGTPATTAPADAGGFDQALAGQASGGNPPPSGGTPSVPAPAVHAPPSAEIPAGPPRPLTTLGDTILRNVGTLQKGDAALRTGKASSVPGSAEPELKVAARLPGPAEARPVPPDTGERSAARPETGRDPIFERNLAHIQQVSGQMIQVSVVSKTTGSFTGAINKLMSSS